MYNGAMTVKASTAAALETKTQDCVRVLGMLVGKEAH